MNSKTTNVVIAGIGGQGVIRASDILADAAFRAGRDVKKAEVHGMSQRGGSVTTDVRFGERIWSPMVPEGEADFLVVLEDTQVDPTRHMLAPGGVLLMAGEIDVGSLPTAKALNVAMLGRLSTFLDIEETTWLDAVRTAFPEKLYEANLAAFRTGQAIGRKEQSDA